jgi:hypothetical protein
MPVGAADKPRFWVERFCVWGEGNKPVREILLKPGLNIIWSPDSRSEDDPIGHGAGKTTFCRLLRFCLGENSFGSGEQQDRIKSAFPTGKVGVEVHVDGVRWAIVRPFRRYNRETVVRDATVELALVAEHPTETMAAFITAVQSAFFGGVHKLLPQKVREEEVWEAALAWLSRDQECRFDGPLDWRHAHTDSESTVRNLKLEERSQVARAILGCFSADEAVLEQEGSASAPSSADIEADRLAWAINRQQRKLAEALGTDAILGISSLDMDLLEQQVRERFPGLPEATRTALRIATQSALSRHRRATQKLRDLQDSYNAQLVEHTGKMGLTVQKRGITDSYSASVTVSSQPACRVCSVPLDRIFEEGCPCSTADADLDLIKQRHTQSVEDLLAAGAAETASKEHLDALATAVVQAKAIEEAGLQALLIAEADENEAKSASDEGYRLLDTIETLRGLIRDHESCVSQIAEEGHKTRERTGQLKSLRAGSRRTIQGLSARFDEVLRELFPGEVTGTVSLDGPNLELKVGPGERSTAAIDSWKAVAFDLSALTLACEGLAHLPPWLLHDSPREADLGESIYERLFTFVSTLEQMARFQYIVTTTTPPPAAMRKEPYLRATLKGGPATDRLLGCTL